MTEEYRITVKEVKYFIFLLRDTISKVALIDSCIITMQPLLSGHLLYTKKKVVKQLIS